MLRQPIQHLYPLEVRCQKDSIDSQPEKMTTDVDVQDNKSHQSENQDSQTIVKTTPDS